jgi:hypothetical protein
LQKQRPHAEVHGGVALWGRDVLARGAKGDHLMQTDSYGGAIAALVKRSTTAVWVIQANIVAFALVLIGEVLELAGIINLEAVEPDMITLAYLLIMVAQLIAFIASVVVISMWIHRAHRNLHEAGYPGLSYTPGWAVGWFFIPIANLFKPFQAMRSLWSESHGIGDSYAAPAPGMLSAWWGCWIAGNILGNVSMRMGMMGDGSNQQVALVIGLASSVGMIGAAWFIMKIVQDITAAQVSNLNSAEVFA